MAITVAELAVKVGANVDGAVNGLGAVQKQLSSFGGKALAMGGILSAGITAPLAAMAAKSVDAAAQLDTQMRNIQSVGKQTDAELAKLSQTFVNMSTDASVTTDSAEQLAMGFYDIQSSGFAGADAMTVLRESTKAASAGLTDTAVASKAIVATLNAYSLGAEEAAHVSDVLFRTMDIGVVSFEELAVNLGDIVGTGATAGVSIEELGAAMATMTKSGISAAEASTSLNQLMLSFISPSTEAAKAAADLGIDLSATALASKGLAGTMREVEEATGGDAEAMAALFPNVRALRGAVSLVREDMGPFAEDLAAIGDASGATTAAFDTQARSFEAHKRTFDNTVQALQISIGNILLPILSQFMAGLTPLIEGFNQLDGGTQRIIVVFAGLLAAIGPILVIIGTFAKVLGVALPVISAVAGAIGSIAAPVLLVAGVIAVLAAAWAGNWGGMRDALSSFWTGTAQPILASLGQWLQSALPAAVSFLAGVWNGVFLPAIRAVWSFLSTYVLPLLSSLANLVGAVLSTAVRALAGLWQNVLQPALAVAWEWLKKVAEIISDKLQPVLTFLKDKLLGPVANAFRAVGSAVSKVIGHINSLADRIRNLKLPPWLTPGSPTPFEIGLRGIADAMGRLPSIRMPEVISPQRLQVSTAAAGSVGMSAGLPQPAGRRLPVPRSVSGAGGGGIHVEVRVSGSVISERDLATTVRNELLKLKRRNPATGL